MATTEDRELELLQAIREGCQAKGYVPSRRELAEMMGISTSRVQQLVNGCCEKGLLERKPHTARACVINRPEDC